MELTYRFANFQLPVIRRVVIARFIYKVFSFLDIKIATIPAY